MIDFEYNNIFYYFKMNDEDWGQFIVIDDNKDSHVSHKKLYVNSYSCLYTFLDETHFEILRKPIIMDNCLCFSFAEEMISFCFKNLLCGNH